MEVHQLLLLSCASDSCLAHPAPWSGLQGLSPTLLRALCNRGKQLISWSVSQSDNQRVIYRLAAILVGAMSARRASY